MCLSFHAAAQGSKPLADYVKPNIGTAHSRWFFYTPAAMPLGMAKVAPSTNGSLGNKDGWQAVGYDSRHTSIEGFVNLHEFQVGGIVLMPTKGRLVTVPGLPTDKEKKGYRSRFERKNEVATAGYYSVLLDDYDIKAEVTATPRVAFQRFTFPAGKDNHILFNIGNRQGESGAVKDAYVRYTADGRVEGWVITEPEYVKKYQPGATVPLYFSAVMDKKPAAYGSYNGEKQQQGAGESKGVGAGMYFTFAMDKTEPVTVKIGLSYTSVENARANLTAETEKMTFDKVREQSHKTWNDYLGRIEVETSKNDDKVKFYTGLYHALLGRGLASDVNGAYPRNDGTVGQLPVKDGKPLYNVYNTDAAWGAQWNLSQLWILAYPEYMSQYVSTHLQAYKDAGWLADGLANNRYVSGVGTNLLSTIIAAAYECGIRDFDTKLAYEACLKNELDGENRPLGAGKATTADFLKYGYVPHRDRGEENADTYSFSASHTLEFSYSAWVMAQWAKSIGDKKNYDRLMYLSKGWERLYDTSCDFIRPKKADGKFIDNFNPMEVWRGFQEGNAWQYTWLVPHDVHGLVNLFGSEKKFVTKLDSLFVVEGDLGENASPDISGLVGQYAHGNEPSHHVIYMYNYVGQPWKAAPLLRKMMNEMYFNEPDGLCGNEDVGQMSAWYILSTVGLYQVDPSGGRYIIGSPLFNRADLNVGNGKTFSIVARNNSDRNIYVQKAYLNGREYKKSYIDFADIKAGGKLELVMGSKPSKWGTKTADRP